MVPSCCCTVPNPVLTSVRRRLCWRLCSVLSAVSLYRVTLSLTVLRRADHSRLSASSLQVMMVLMYGGRMSSTSSLSGSRSTPAMSSRWIALQCHWPVRCSSACRGVEASKLMASHPCTSSMLPLRAMSWGGTPGSGDVLMWAAMTSTSWLACLDRVTSASSHASEVQVSSHAVMPLACAAAATFLSHAFLASLSSSMLPLSPLAKPVKRASASVISPPVPSRRSTHSRSGLPLTVAAPSSRGKTRESHASSLERRSVSMATAVMMSFSMCSSPST
mmetsp:Transcript_28902/g.73794  ORF Transcript_28902/g.73794 Transcript_28902/m.73794 type:complete len:276 (-) Transcript_28902:924-1751(-)